MTEAQVAHEWDTWRTKVRSHGVHLGPRTVPVSSNCGKPIVVQHGGSYSGCWVGTPDGAAVTIATAEPVTITTSTVKGPAELIASSTPGAKVTIVDSTLLGQPVKERGHWGEYAVRMASFDYCRIEHVHVEQKAGFRLSDWSGASQGPPVLVRFNTAHNIDGRRSNGRGGFSGSAIAQFLQFDGVRNAAAVDVSWNEIRNDPDSSSVADNINIYDSSGTADSPIDIHDNLVDGAFPYPATSRDYSGGGILLGDLKGDHELARDNQVLSTTNYGLAIAGGLNSVLKGNRAVATGFLPDGRPLPAMNVGIAVWHYYADQPFGNNQAYGNVAGWFRATAGRYAVGREDWWLPGCTTRCANEHL